MKTFIFFNLKKLIQPIHFVVIFMYLTFAWFLNSPLINPIGLSSTTQATVSYDLILMTIMNLYFILNIANHYLNEVNNLYIAIIRTKINDFKIFFGFTVSYLLYYILGFVFPTYLVALIQQIVTPFSIIEFKVYILKVISSSIGYSFIWIIIAIILVIKFRDVFLVIIIFMILYGVSQIFNLITSNMVFNQLWLYDYYISDNYNALLKAGLYLCLIILITIYISKIICRNYSKQEITELYKNGIYSKLLEKFNFSLSCYHLKMMGLKNQKILSFFIFIGMILIIPLTKIPNINITILVKVYIGAFIPLLFSFNQYYIIEIDRNAGMLHNNYLRKISYFQIIINRWLILIIPQTFCILFSIIIVNVFIDVFSLLLLPYIILLVLSLSLINLFISILARNNYAANITIFFFVYLQLRDDFQSFILEHAFLKQINIFKPLLENGNSNIYIWQWLFMILIIIILTFFIKKILKKLTYVSLGNN